ncbi:unnamed protein product [Arctia plantaginis]|uniref:Uncharacterized protein n=1 Tax=Arctia plantaginis TaxID=874455 RepID=A0A8S0ZLP8_ARCPL|nr:unnamed protein product [Arctia plantaginis]
MKRAKKLKIKERNETSSVNVIQRPIRAVEKKQRIIKNASERKAIPCSESDSLENSSNDSSIKNDMVENLSLNSSSFIENSPQCTQTDNINIFTLTHSIETQQYYTLDKESILNQHTPTRKPVQGRRVSSSSCSSSSRSSSNSSSSSSSRSSSSASRNAQNMKFNVITSHINVDGASTSQLATRSGRAISKSNYFASPINGPESDPDLSD